MRPLYLAAAPVGIGLVLLALASLVALCVLGTFSRGGKNALGELTGEKRCQR